MDRGYGWATLSSVIVLVTMLGCFGNANAAAVYDYLSPDPQTGLWSSGGSGFNNVLELGDEVTLSGIEGAVKRVIQFEFVLGQYLPGNPLTVRIYNGAGGGITPGTMLWSSDPIDPQDGHPFQVTVSNGATRTYYLYQVAVPNVAVVDSMVWSIGQPVPSGGGMIPNGFRVLGNAEARWIRGPSGWSMLPRSQPATFAFLSRVTGVETNEVDSDLDGVPDGSDNCPVDTNVSQSDVDNDGSGDLCDECPSDALDECDANGSTAQEVSPGEGGTVTTPDGGLDLDIDPGDLGSDQTISVTQTVFNDPEADLRIGGNAGAGQTVASYDLQPDGLTFSSPATLTINADVTSLNANQRNNLDLYLFNETMGVFEALMASCLVTEDPIATFTAVCVKEVSHFSSYALIAPQDSDNDGVFDDFGPYEDACPLEDATGFDVDGDGCIDSFQGLADLVQKLVTEGVISSNMQSSLLAKVNAATESSEEADACEAIDELGAFINHVNAQVGKKVSPEAAGEVTDYASSVVTYLGSTATCS